LWYGGALAICSAEEFKQSKLVCVSALNALHGNADCDNHLRATPPVLSLWPYKRKLIPVHLFNSDALSCMLILPQLPGHTDSVSDAAFHPKELIIGLCGSDKQVYLGEMDCLV